MIVIDKGRSPDRGLSRPRPDGVKPEELQPSPEPRGRARRPMRTMRPLLALIVCSASLGVPQSAGAQDLPPREAPSSSAAREVPAAGPVTFEVASVKQNKSTDGVQNVRILPAGRIEITNMSLRTLIRIAYGARIQSSSQIVATPSWAVTDGWDILAKAEGDAGFDPTSGQPLRLIGMLKALLEDRFKVKVHTETREAPVYALMLANRDGKFGANLSESRANCYSPGDPPPQNAPPDPARNCGIHGGMGTLSYTGLSMQQIATHLAGLPVVGRPVIDRTGLTARYNFHVEFVPAFIPSAARDGSNIANPAADTGSNLFTALVEQGGLKLQADRAPLEFVVVDRAQKPTEE